MKALRRGGQREVRDRGHADAIVSPVYWLTSAFIKKRSRAATADAPIGVIEMSP